MIKVLMRFQSILPTLSTVEFSVDPYNIYSTVDDFTAICIGNKVTCLGLVHKQ